MTRITAELKSLGSVDTGEDPTDPARLLELERWSPDDRERFHIVVNEVGVELLRYFHWEFAGMDRE
jgi:hypothetical protein